MTREEVLHAIAQLSAEEQSKLGMAWRLSRPGWVMVKDDLIADILVGHWWATPLWEDVLNRMMPEHLTESLTWFEHELRRRP